MKLLLSIILAPIPKRYRHRWTWADVDGKGAFVSGLVQLGIFLGLCIHHYFSFMNSALAMVPDRAFLSAAEADGDTAVRGFGLILFFAFFADPITLLLIYFQIEGLVRAIAGMITGDAVASLPLQLLSATHTQIKRFAAERSLGPRIPDEVQKSGLGATDKYDLLIASCRPKADRHYRLNTIAYEDELYEVTEMQNGPPPRRFIYLLKKKHAAKLVRGLHHYDPRDVLTAPEQPPGFRAAFLQGLKVLNVIAHDFRVWISDD